MTDENLYYILDRLEEILDDTRQKEDHVLRGVEALKRELIYNLGADQWMKFIEGENQLLTYAPPAESRWTTRLATAARR